MSSIESLQQQLAKFARERDWEQFHTPKNIAMALTVEAAELLEHFQWLTPEQSEGLSDKKLAEIQQEMADVQLYLLRLAQILNVDILAACEEKMRINAEKYPADKVKGSARKYSEYD